MPTTLHNFTLCGTESNDIVTAMEARGYKMRVLADITEMLVRVTRGSGVIVCADGYPARGAAVTREMLEIAREKNLRLIIEYPSSVYGLEIGAPLPIRTERLIAKSDFTGIPKGSLLMPQGGYYLPAVIAKTVMRLGKAAGYDRLAFEAPENAVPAVFFHPDYENVLVSTCCLFRFATARAAPKDHWHAFLRKILSWAAGVDAAPVDFDWLQDPSPSHGRNERLADAGMTAFQRGTAWLAKNMVCAIDDEVMMLEGFQSRIDHDGNQRIRTVLRADGLAESAMLFAADAEKADSPVPADLSRELLDSVWSPRFYNGKPEEQCFGLVNWLDRRQKFYGDDNARVLLASIAARGMLGDTRWDERILRCLLANLRTVNRHGYRLRSMWAHEMEKNGWRHYRDTDVEIIQAPHFQGYLWAAFLWAFRLTGYEPFRDKAAAGIRTCMEACPDRWNWTNSLTAEMARMLLPLAFLVKTDDTPEHRAWLLRVCGDLIAQMTPDGAIEDLLGAIANGTYPPPQSNEGHGTGEASLIQKNGDPATDLLYTANWAFLGLHEAAIALGENAHRDRIREAEDRLADFLCRIQLKSTLHPELDGAWMRGFDFNRWEYYGSSADSGWGAWCVEAGWVNTWIPTVFALRGTGRSLTDLYDGTEFREAAPDLIKEMMIE